MKLDMKREMKREIAAIFSILTYLGTIATIISAKVWILCACSVVLGGAAVFFGARRMVYPPGMPPMPGDPQLVGSPYSVVPPDKSSILWASEVAKQVYTGVDVIPHRRMLEWFKANPNGFFTIKDRYGRCCGNIDILPLRPETLTRLLSGQMLEKEIRGKCIYRPDERQYITDLYLESLVAIDADYHGNPYALQSALLGVPSMLPRLCCPRDGSNSTVYAIGGSSNGIRLMEHLGFSLISSGSDRKDKHDVYAIKIHDLVSNIRTIGGTPLCETKTSRSWCARVRPECSSVRRRGVR